MFIASSCQCYTFFLSRKRPASAASKTNFCSKLLASVGFSHIYQRACLFTAIFSKNPKKFRDRGEHLLHACFCFMQCTHSHDAVNPMASTAHSSSRLEVNNFLITGQTETLTVSSSTFSKCFPAVGALAQSEKRQPPREHRLTTSKKFFRPEKEKN